MRWLFKKSRIIGDIIEYLYSFESDDLDGIITYDKREKTISINKPCKNDKDSKWCIERTTGKFYTYIVQKDFPEEKAVITG